jgi:hypothetical protein
MVKPYNLQEPYRCKGLAKAMAAKVFRDSTSEYGPDVWCAADVPPDNLGSIAVCKGLNGKRAWEVSW